MNTEKLFPPYLNKGSKGPAVAMLQTILLTLDCNRKIIVNGDYGEETETGVKNLQNSIGMEDEDIDGHFGPKTRRRLIDFFGGFDVNTIPIAVFRGENEAIGP